MNVVMCDVCKVNPAKRITLYLGKEMGPAGDSESVYGRVDLCPTCHLKVLEDCVSDYCLYKDETFNQMFLDRAKVAENELKKPNK